MCGFVSRLLGVHRIGIQIGAPLDTKALALLDITLEILIRTAGILVTISDPQDRKIHTCCLDGLPVDLALKLADVDALRGSAIGQRIHGAT